MAVPAGHVDATRSDGCEASAREVSVLVVGALLVVSQLYATIPLQARFAERFGVTPAGAALAGAGFGLAFAVGNLVFPTVSDRVDARRSWPSEPAADRNGR